MLCDFSKSLGTAGLGFPDEVVMLRASVGTVWHLKSLAEVGPQPDGCQAVGAPLHLYSAEAWLGLALGCREKPSLLLLEATIQTAR